MKHTTVSQEEANAWFNGQWLYDAVMKHINPELITEKIDSLSTENQQQHAHQYADHILQCRDMCDRAVFWFGRLLLQKKEKKSDAKEMEVMRHLEESFSSSGDPFTK